MKIALCSKGKFSLEKGFTKNRIELADSLQKLGWEALLVDKNVIGIPPGVKYNPVKYNLALKNYLMANGDQFDVVLYEYDTLPFDRNLFSKGTLFVARPAILAFHFPLTKFKYNLKTKLSHLFKRISSKLSGVTDGTQAYYRQIQYSLIQADVVQVQNTKDRDLLIYRGFSPEKIIIVPNGITAERIAKFDVSAKEYKEPYTVAFVGTFDFRKGAMDFPVFFGLLKKRFPSIRLKLLGTKGIFQTSENVLRIFPRKYHESIEVIPQFKSEDLPHLLKDCHAGVFPSYLESFGFGALEMMCAGLPVAAYDCPGPSDFILPGLLAPTGDPVALSKRLISLLEDKEQLRQKAQQARGAVVQHYCWDDIAKSVDAVYKLHLQKLRQGVFVELPV